MNSFAISCYRIILGIERIVRVTDAEVYRRIKAQPLVYTVLKCQMTFLVLRMDPCEPAHRYALYHSPHGGRRPGRQNIRISYPKYIQGRLGDSLGMLPPSQITNLTSHGQDNVA